MNDDVKKRFRKNQWVKTVQKIDITSQAWHDNYSDYHMREYYTSLGIKAGIVGQIIGAPYDNWDGYFTVIFELGNFVLTKDIHQDFLEKAKRPK